MKPLIDFCKTFEALTGHQPFPWQEALYRRFVSDGPDHIPSSCCLPTGVGKTSVLAIWLLALAACPERMPRRLVYVVNRRTVVDQTTTEAEKLQDAVKNGKLDGIQELAISTLRGQMADNREWCADPSRPAIIVGTVDMIGSRLLFSGYGVGFKARPLHAGFLGQDALLVHDEAHLEPAFQKLIESIESEQNMHETQRGKIATPWPNLRIMQLTATTRNATESNGAAVTLSSNDNQHPVVRQRIQANKRLALHEVNEEKQAADKIADLALTHRNNSVAVLVFVRTIDDVKKVCDRLKDKKNGVPTTCVQQLTGTMRGLERDALAKSDPVFMRFLPEKNRNPEVKPAVGTVYLVCTSAGEVGIDISADHMVCDLSTFESMAQRFGRVNRYGDRADTRIDVVYPVSFGKIDRKTGALKTDEIDKRRRNTLELLKQLPPLGENIYNASPAALSNLPEAERVAAFAPEPVIPPATDILFDAWSLTSIRQPMPGRPPVEPYLHGITSWQLPETHVAWREEVERITGDLMENNSPEELLEAYPLKPHELLRDRSDRIFKELEKIEERCPDQAVWLLDDRGNYERCTTLQELISNRNAAKQIEGKTILLPPSTGGLKNGMLDGNEPVPTDQTLDVADTEERQRIWDEDEAPDGMRRIFRPIRFPGPDDDDEDVPVKVWLWYEKFGEGGSTAAKAVEWSVHVQDVEHKAEQFLQYLPLDERLKMVVKLAAAYHDHGKERRIFQNVFLGNRNYPPLVLAKSGGKGGRYKETYRHEFGSLLDVQQSNEFQSLADDERDLVLHLIAAHHGRARPHFDLDEAFDPERPVGATEAVAVETPRRFARLQRKYGRWGLAYLESLLRAADWAASAAPSQVLAPNGNEVTS